MIHEIKERMADVANLCRRYDVEELHLFGSATSAVNIAEVGDLDFLVRFKDAPPPGTLRTTSASPKALLRCSTVGSTSLNMTPSATPTFEPRWRNRRNPSMASREVQKLLFDMKQAGELIETFVAGRSFEEYHGDAMLKSAVERQFGSSVTL